jgi:hypothetical protein
MTQAASPNPTGRVLSVTPFGNSQLVFGYGCNIGSAAPISITLRVGVTALNSVVVTSAPANLPLVGEAAVLAINDCQAKGAGGYRATSFGFLLAIPNPLATSHIGNTIYAGPSTSALTFATGSAAGTPAFTVQAPTTTPCLPSQFPTWMDDTAWDQYCPSSTLYQNQANSREFALKIAGKNAENLADLLFEFDHGAMVKANTGGLSGDRVFGKNIICEVYHAPNPQGYSQDEVLHTCVMAFNSAFQNAGDPTTYDGAEPLLPISLQNPTGLPAKLLSLMDFSKDPLAVGFSEFTNEPSDFRMDMVDGGNDDKHYFNQIVGPQAEALFNALTPIETVRQVPIKMSSDISISYHFNKAGTQQIETVLLNGVGCMRTSSTAPGSQALYACHFNVQKFGELTRSFWYAPSNNNAFWDELFTGFSVLGFIPGVGTYISIALELFELIECFDPAAQGSGHNAACLALEFR